jgi:hypothetical protein
MGRRWNAEHEDEGAAIAPAPILGISRVSPRFARSYLAGARRAREAESLHCDSV